MPCVIEIAREPRTLFTHRHRFADSENPGSRTLENPRCVYCRRQWCASFLSDYVSYGPPARLRRRLETPSKCIDRYPALLLAASQVRATPNGRRLRREARKRPSRRGPRGVVARGPDARWTRRVCAGATGARRPAAPSRREARGAPPARDAREARAAIRLGAVEPASTARPRGRARRRRRRGSRRGTRTRTTRASRAPRAPRRARGRARATPPRGSLAPRGCSARRGR